MKYEQVIHKAQQWLKSHEVNQVEAWLVSHGAFEMQCPYIYPPVSRYRDMLPEEIYTPMVTWGEQAPALYIHIPYCITRCNFCNFALDELRHKSAPIEEYLAALEQEIVQVLALADFKQVPVSSIYIGGGTPSVLNSKQLRELFSLIERYFVLVKGGEFSFEVNPDTVQGSSAQKFKILKEAGVTRVSLGVQSMEDDMLHSLKRLHNTDMIRYAVEKVREFDIEHLNIDLMYYLPQLTAERWLTTLDRAVSLKPDSITFYELRIAPHSELNVTARLRDHDRNLQRALALHRLTDAGYVCSSPNQYITQWNHAQKHYVDVRERLVDIIAVGVSAISSIGPVAFRGPMTLADYMQKLTQGRLIYRGIHMRPEEQYTRAMVLGLKSPRGVSPTSYRNRFGVSVKEVFSDILADMCDLGILEMNEAHIRTTAVGSFFIDQISTLFFQSEDVIAVKTHEIEHLGVFWH